MDNPIEEQPSQPKRGAGKRKIILFGTIGILVIAAAILFYFF